MKTPTRRAVAHAIVRDESSLTLHEKICRGDYQPKQPYPAALGLFAADLHVGGLTVEELEALVARRRAYDADAAERKAQMNAWQEESARLDRQFYHDLDDHYGLPHGDAFVQAMHGVAYDRGHSDGFAEIACEMGDLMPLWRAHQKALTDALEAARAAT